MQIGPIVVTNWWGMMFVAISAWSIVQLITVGVIAEIKKAPGGNREQCVRESGTHNKRRY